MKANLWATLPAENGETKIGGLVLSGHTDVVPVDGQPWVTDPFVAQIIGDRLYGRGVTDMKSYGATALMMVPELLKRKLKAMHRQLTKDGPFDPIYDVPHTTIHTGVIHGGTALNIIPRDCDVTWEIRHHHLNSPEELFAQAKTFADSLIPAMRAVAADTGITHHLNSVLPGFATEANSQIAQLCFTCAGTDNSSVSSSDGGKVSFGTEAALFHQAGVPTIVCGPGHIAQAHQPNEWVELAQLAWCERFMRRLADQICVN